MPFTTHLISQYIYCVRLCRATSLSTHIMKCYLFNYLQFETISVYFLVPTSSLEIPFLIMGLHFVWFNSNNAHRWKVHFDYGFSLFSLKRSQFQLVGAPISIMGTDGACQTYFNGAVPFILPPAIDPGLRARRMHSPWSISWGCDSLPPDQFVAFHIHYGVLHSYGCDQVCWIHPNSYA
jgi:hypothetical protein